MMGVEDQNEFSAERQTSTRIHSTTTVKTEKGIIKESILMYQVFFFNLHQHTLSEFQQQNVYNISDVE
jgi:hypothetical protein